MIRRPVTLTIGTFASVREAILAIAERLLADTTIIRPSHVHADLGRLGFVTSEANVNATLYVLACNGRLSRPRHGYYALPGAKAEPATERPAEPREPAIRADTIDVMSDGMLDGLVMERIYGEIYGTVPAIHPRAEAFLQANPGVRRDNRRQWFWPNCRPGYDSHFWAPDDPSTDLCDAWRLMQTMLSHPNGPAFERMLLEGKFHRLEYQFRHDAAKDAARFITRCALKAFLLPDAR